MTKTPRTEQLAFDASYEIAALPLPHTDAICNILTSKFGQLELELAEAKRERDEWIENFKRATEIKNAILGECADAHAELTQLLKIAEELAKALQCVDHDFKSTILHCGGPLHQIVKKALTTYKKGKQ